MQIIKKELTDIIKKSGMVGKMDFAAVPNPDMGDVALPCFELAKKEKKSPADIAKEVADKIEIGGLISKVLAVGPYVNIYLDTKEAVELIIQEISKKDFGKSDIGKGKKILVEYGCPNPLKVFHLGHLKNLITGESVAKILENVGYEVVRVNYQGDVGMHVAKTMWALDKAKGEPVDLEKQSLEEKVKFLGKKYAEGVEAFENDENSKEAILKMNEMIYERDKSIQDIYNKTRQWSLDYFEQIYKKLNVKFDQYYFESEMYERGLQLVNGNLENGIFTKSQGAIIFEGSKHSLHDRVFVNSKGYPTYEAKEMALAETRYNEYHPDQIIHVVGKEQTEYFKVVFTALEKVVPESKGKSHHLVGGYLQLKGMKKMSSRTGNVIAGDELVANTEKVVVETMAGRDIENKEEVIRKVTGAVLKYAMLKSNVSQDVGFDMKTSVSFNGDSGPYLLYIVARIKSIMGKINSSSIQKMDLQSVVDINEEEKQLLFKMSEYSESVKIAATEKDPSKVAQYLFDLAQKFNAFYDNSPVMQEKDTAVQAFRLALIENVLKIMVSGLDLLGIEAVEKM